MIRGQHGCNDEGKIQRRHASAAAAYMAGSHCPDAARIPYDSHERRIERSAASDRGVENDPVDHDPEHGAFPVERSIRPSPPQILTCPGNFPQHAARPLAPEAVSVSRQPGLKRVAGGKELRATNDPVHVVVLAEFCEGLFVGPNAPDESVFVLTLASATYLHRGADGTRFDLLGASLRATRRS